ncbi:MAG: right-handed parallel beta-helix repeat-containing protein [Anaerolineae bacterium]
MLKKSLTLTGTILLACVVLLALFVLLSLPETVIQAAPPPDCILVNQDITTDTIWNAPCYHVVTTTVTVIPGAVLTITPPVTGTAIYFDTGARLQVEGNLQALGTASRPITFTASDPTGTSPCGGQGRWLGILFGTNSGQNRIHYVLIEYACTGIAPSGSTASSDGDQILSNTLRYNGGTGEFHGAIGGDIDYSEIGYNAIYSCSNGIVLNEGSRNLIGYNSIRDIANMGLYLKGGATGGGSYNMINRNAIYDCAVAGIRAEESNNNSITNNEIYNCGAEGIGMGDGSTNIATGNVVYRTMLSSAAPGGAISVISQTSILVQNNYIYDNGGGSGYRAGLYIDKTPEVLNRFLSNVISDTQANAIHFTADTGSASINRAWYNALCSIPAYELQNDASVAIDANYNRWGTPHPNTPTVGTDPLNDNIHGLINPNPLTTWISFAVEGDASGVVTVTLRDQDGNTVPAPLSPEHTPTVPAPNARQIALESNWGTFSPATVVVDGNGVAAATLQQGAGPAPAQILITATDFCGESVFGTLALPDLAITKTALTTQTVVGELVTYRIDYANEGDATATGLTIRDTLPVGMAWVADTAVPPWTRVATTPDVVWTLPSLAAGASGSFLVTTTVNITDACGLQLTNMAVITGTTLEARLDNNADSAEPVTVLCPAIEILKTGPALSKVTDVVTYTYTITNTSVPPSAPALDLVSVIDQGVGWPGLGDLTATALANGCGPLATGAACTFEAPYTVAAGVPDPLVNEVMATYQLAAFNQVVTATDSHSVNLFQPSITFSKTGDPLSKIGDATTYTLTLANTSSSDSPDLECRITDALLGLDQTVTLASGAAPYVLAHPFTVPAGAADPLVNTANVTCSPVGFPNIITATDSHTVDLFQPSVQVEKSGPDEAHPGDAINYTFRITNTGSTDSPALVLDSVIDVGVGWPGLGDLTSLAASNGCASLASGAACAFTVPYVIPSTTPNGALTNTVSVLYHPLDFTNQITDTDQHVLAVTGAIDIVVIKDDNVGPVTNTLMTAENQAVFDRWQQTAAVLAPTQHREFVFEGDLITYTISVVNVGAVPATNVVLTETLPLYTSYVGYGWTLLSGRTYITSVGTLQPGEGVVRYFVVRVDEPLAEGVDNLDNLVCGMSDVPDATPDDNCNHEDTPVLRRPQIEKTFTSPMGVAGQVISFTITYTNPNDVPITGARITDTLPPDTTWHSDTAVDAGWERLATAPEIVWYTPTLGAGAVGSFILNVIYDPAVEACGITLTNTVTLTLLNAGEPYFADEDTATFTIECPADLVVIKDDDVGPTTPFAMAKQATIERLLQREVTTMGITQHREFVYEGDLITYTIAVENVGPYTATNVVLTELLPLYTDYVGYGWTLVSGRTYTMALGTLAPGQGGIYYFVVRVYDIVPDGVNNLVNYVCGWSAETDYNPDDNCNYEDTPLRRRPLRISKTAPRCISPGDDFNYSTFYTNTSLITDFTDVLITDTLSSYVTYEGAVDTWMCTGQVCRYTIDSIPAATYNQPGPLLPVRLSPAFSYTADSVIVNTIEISGGYRYVLTHTVDLGPDVVVVKNDNIGPQPPEQQAVWDEVAALLERPVTTQSEMPGEIQSVAQRLYARPGEIITYTILYANTGIAPANDVVLTERLPDYTTYVGGGWTHAGGRYYTMSLGTLAPRQGGELVFMVEVVDPFPLGVDRVINEVRIATTDEECDLTNNVSYDDTPVRTDALLYVANRDSDTIDVFETTTFAHVTSFSTGDIPFGMVVVDDQLYVANTDGPAPTPASQVQVFDLATHSLITNVTTGYGTLYLTALDGYVYATDHDYGGEGITVIEHATHDVVARLRPNRFQVYDWGFLGITADPTRGQVYTTKHFMGAQGLWTITSTLTPLDFGLHYNVDTGDALPYSTIYNPATDHIYVTFPHLHEVRVYEPSDVPIGDFSEWQVFATQQQAPTPDSTDGGKGMAVMGECTYNSNFAAQSVSVIAEGPCDALYSLGGSTAQATPLTPQDTIIFGFHVYLPIVMKGAQSYPYVAHIAVGGRPKGLAAGGGIVFVTLPEQNRVAVIDTRVGSVVAYIPTPGTYPHTAVIVYDAPWLDQ